MRRSAGVGRPVGRSSRAAARRFIFGLSTVLGLKPLGFFVPYRRAAAAVPLAYPALEPLFRAAEPAFAALLSDIEGHATDLLAIASGDGPARFDQDWFARLDACAAYAMVRRARPRTIIEIGSGHSTRFLARAVADGGLATAVTAIDPEPRAHLSGLGVRHEPVVLGEVDPQVFDVLGPSDILFVDSSHVAMPGSDLDRIVGDILPRLPAGVLIHLHDIFLPDPYPAEWRWRGYNESIVAAALIGGAGYGLEFSSRWVSSRQSGRLVSGVVGRLPASAGPSSSLWLRKL